MLKADVEGRCAHATTWVSLEDIGLSETSQPQKDRDHVTPLLEGSRAVRVLEKEWHMVAGG